MKLKAILVLAAASAFIAAEAGAQGLRPSQAGTRPTQNTGTGTGSVSTAGRVSTLAGNLSAALSGSGPAAGLASRTVQAKMVQIIDSANSVDLQMPLNQAMEQAASLYEVRNSEEGARAKMEALAVVMNTLANLYEVSFTIQGQDVVVSGVSDEFEQVSLATIAEFVVSDKGNLVANSASGVESARVDMGEVGQAKLILQVYNREIANGTSPAQAAAIAMRENGRTTVAEVLALNRACGFQAAN